MASIKTRPSSFSRNTLVGSMSEAAAGLKPGPNGAIFTSSGIPDMDKILGGGFCLGSLIMVIEDAEAPHHLLLLRRFMSQGLVHNQPLLYSSPLKDPRGFLGTLPSPMSSKDDKPHDKGLVQMPSMNIAMTLIGGNPSKDNFSAESSLTVSALMVLPLAPFANVVQHFLLKIQGVMVATLAVAV